MLIARSSPTARNRWEHSIQQVAMPAMPFRRSEMERICLEEMVLAQSCTTYLDCTSLFEHPSISSRHMFSWDWAFGISLTPCLKLLYEGRTIHSFQKSREHLTFKIRPPCFPAFDPFTCVCRWWFHKPKCQCFVTKDIWIQIYRGRVPQVVQTSRLQWLTGSHYRKVFRSLHSSDQQLYTLDLNIPEVLKDPKSFPTTNASGG